MQQSFVTTLFERIGTNTAAITVALAAVTPTAVAMATAVVVAAMEVVDTAEVEEASVAAATRWPSLVPA
jgi:hypothetical protein